jgi:putative superfamily III holin-X
VHTEKSLATILAETKAEIQQFVTTRVDMLKAEMDQKVRTFKTAIPVILVAAGLLLAGWISLTFAAIALLHSIFVPSPYAWFWAGLIVAGAYLGLGIAAGWFAYSKIKATGVIPSRTLTVLKQDQAWIRKEARAT